jgi:hypothetical protein
VRLLPKDNCLLVYDNGDGSILVYLEQLHSLGPAVRRGAYKKILQGDKLGGAVLLAYDEVKRTLAVSGQLQVVSASSIFIWLEPDNRQLHVFVFDEKYTTLLGFGSTISLASWYEGLTKIVHIAFAGGAGEELLLVDEHRRARVFSLITQQFRFVLFEPVSTRL